MEVCYDETTKTWITRPLSVSTVAPTFRERITSVFLKLVTYIKSFLKLD
jgi:hypothetical protein